MKRTLLLITVFSAALIGTSQGSLIVAEYHLGEPGSLGANNIPLDSSGNGRNFTNAISGGNASVASGGVVAPGSTHYLDTSGTGNEGWYGGALTGLPIDNFAMGIYARASAGAGNQGSIFTTAGGNGGFKVSLNPNGWGASEHGIAWIGTPDGEPGSFTPDTWTHLALIRYDGVTDFYIDGVAQGYSYTGAPSMGSGHLAVAPGGASSSYFDGQLDEARIVTFTSGESVNSIMNTLRGVPEPSSVIGLLGLVGGAFLKRKRRKVA